MAAPWPCTSRTWSRRPAAVLKQYRLPSVAKQYRKLPRGDTVAATKLASSSFFPEVHVLATEPPIVMACTALERVQTKSSSVLTGFTRTEFTAISVGAPGVGLQGNKRVSVPQHQQRRYACRCHPLASTAPAHTIHAVMIPSQARVRVLGSGIRASAHLIRFKHSHVFASQTPTVPSLLALYTCMPS